MIYPARSLREITYKINLCKKSLDSERMSKVVSDDYGTSLKLFPTKYGLATPNNIHHLMHVSSYISCSGEGIFSSPVYVEFGGGYGNMARLMKLFNESATYVIVDISVILGIQYWYLSNTIGENNISICTDGKIIRGKINLISTEIFLDINLHSLINDFIFISTWALTESPEWLQKHKKVRDVLHSAKRLLLASACDTNDFISERLSSNVARVQVPCLEPHHKYMFL